MALAGAVMGAARAGEFSVLWGEDRGYHNFMLAYGARSYWVGEHSGRKMDIHLETSAGRVAASSGSGGNTLWHVGVTPVAQYWLTPQIAIELGIGVNVFSGVHLGDKNISTAFQFGDSLGVLHRVAGTPWTLGARFTHYSNAEIKRPNPGQNYLQLRVSYALD
jgi:lipid A 3-O-deacylase